MNLSFYETTAGKLLKSAKDISDAKRPAYTLGDTDVLYNFKSVAARVGITPMQAWSVYFNKHIDAINSMAKDSTLPQAEPIESRFADAINYLLLGYALLEEEKRKKV